MIGIKRIIRSTKQLAVCLLMLCAMSGLFVPMAFAESTGQATLTLHQVFHASTTAPPSETFSYRLSPSLASNPMPQGSDADGYIFTITGTDSAHTAPIIFTEQGCYSYTVEHVTAPQSNYTYDQKVYTIEIWVDNTLNTTVVAYNADGTKPNEIAYEHSYHLSPSDLDAMEDPLVVKTVNGNPSQDSVFTFKLVAGNPENPMPEGSENGVKTLQITGSGQGEFGTWSYSAEGSYFYTISEVNTGLTNYRYDTTVYTITDSVKAENGKLVVTRVITNTAHSRVTSLSFVNSYTGSNDDNSNKAGNTGNTGSDNTSGTAGKVGPKTGDDAHAALYGVLMCVAAGAALGSVWYLLRGIARTRKGDT